MGKIQTEVKWQGDMSFEANSRGHKTYMDIKEESGGKNSAPTPKELTLMSICGCSGIDVVSLLKKMRVPFETFTMDAETETTEGYPSIFKAVTLNFRVTGPQVDVEKLKKSVHMSMTKYCGVSAMIVKAAPIYYHIYLNQTLVHSDQAIFE